MLEYQLARATAAATFVLLVIGGMVHATGSSLACPDWPLCYGQFFPSMEGGVLYEHGHRLVAFVVSTLTVALAEPVRAGVHQRRELEREARADYDQRAALMLDDA